MINKDQYKITEFRRNRYSVPTLFSNQGRTATKEVNKEGFSLISDVLSRDGSHSQIQSIIHCNTIPDACAKYLEGTGEVLPHGAQI